MSNLIDLIKVMLNNYLVDNNREIITEYMKGILTSETINKLNEIFLLNYEPRNNLIKSMVIYLTIYMYTQMTDYKQLMIYNENCMIDYLKQKYCGLTLLPENLTRFTKFSNYLILINKLFSKRLINTYLDVLARFENPYNYIKYITGSGQKINVTIRTDMIDDIYEYNKIKRTGNFDNNKRKISYSSTSSQSDISDEPKKKRGRPAKLLINKIININMDYIISDPNTYLDIDGTIKYCDIKSLEGFELDMSLFDKE